MESNIFYNKEDIPRGYVLLYSLDESPPYEVDISEVYYDKLNKEFVLVTASGYSCWMGDYETETYKKLKDIETELFKRDDKGYVYNPSLLGAKELVSEASKNWEKIKKTL